MKCPRKQCGYEWETRKDEPKSCPLCKQYIKYEQLGNNGEPLVEPQDEPDPDQHE